MDKKRWKELEKKYEKLLEHLNSPKSYIDRQKRRIIIRVYTGTSGKSNVTHLELKDENEAILRFNYILDLAKHLKKETKIWEENLSAEIKDFDAIRRMATVIDVKPKKVELKAKSAKI